MHYVTIVRDSRFVGCLAGPFETVAEAYPWVEPARELAVKIDDRAWFDSFGVTHVRGRTTPGSLNERLGIGKPRCAEYDNDGNPCAAALPCVHHTYASERA